MASQFKLLQDDVVMRAMYSVVEGCDVWTEDQSLDLTVSVIR